VTFTVLGIVVSRREKITMDHPLHTPMELAMFHAFTDSMDCGPGRLQKEEEEEEEEEEEDDPFVKLYSPSLPLSLSLSLSLCREKREPVLLE